MSKPNNPNVYPESSHVAQNSGDTSNIHGITLLDKFAGNALIGLMSTIDAPNFIKVNGKQGLTHHAYEIANEMLKEREKYLNNE